MRLTNLPKEFHDAKPVLLRIEEAGYQAYFVGGSVRDTIIGAHIHDVDIASSAYPQEIKQLFHRTVDTGIQHGTVMVLYHHHGYEVTTFRTESGYQDYRRPKRVTFIRSLPEDLKRRDFTINALAMDVRGNVTDLFDGLGDIKRKVIKAVGDPNRRFHEDALRMMRAVRFASKLNFKIELRTLRAIKKYSFLLTKIAVERIHSEFVKMMMGMNPQRGLRQMLWTNMYKYVPDFNHHLADLRRINQIQNLRLTNENQVWSLVCFEFGLDRDQIKTMLRHWKSSDRVITDTQMTCTILKLIKEHHLNQIAMYQAGLRILKDADQLAQMLNLGSHWQWIKDQYQRIPIRHKNELKINGRILIKNRVLRPGPRLGQVINRLAQLVILNRLPNQETVLFNVAKKLSKEMKA